MVTYKKEITTIYTDCMKPTVILNTHTSEFKLTCFEFVKYSFAPKFKICNFTRSSSFVKLLAVFLKTSGAIFGTRSQYSPMSQRMLALATGTWENIAHSKLTHSQKVLANLRMSALNKILFKDNWHARNTDPN